MGSTSDGVYDYESEVPWGFVRVTIQAARREVYSTLLNGQGVFRPEFELTPY